MRVVHYPGEILGGYEWMQEQVSMGLIEFYTSTAATGLNPRLDVLNVPGIGLRWDDAVVRYRDPALLSVFETVAEEVGWKLFGVYPLCNNLAVCNERFTPVPDEVRPLGLKMRSMMMKSDELTVDAIGFLATPLPWGEIGSAMMTGVIDGACGPGALDLPVFEGVAKYAYDYFYRLEVSVFIMSLKTWNTLSDEDKAIVKEAADKAIALGWDLTSAVDAHYKASTGDYGIELISLTPEQQIENITAVREQVWPALEETIGKDLVDGVRKFATPLPE
jgi:TRAP-type C4-dicarboxylate transport system substrate-binding protein